MKKTLALLALLPISIMVMMPITTTHASGSGVTIAVYCWADELPNTSGASVTFGGHTVQVACQDDYESPFTEYCVSSAHRGTFVATMTANGNTVVQTGKFGPNMGAINGHMYGSGGAHDFDSYAEFVIGSPCL
jgi:hypothetical protein